MRDLFGKILNILFSTFKIKDDRIIFESGRDKVDDNPYAIYEYLKKNNITKYKYKFLVSKKTDISMLKNGEYIYYRTIKAYYYMATSKYFIKSQSNTSLLKKRPGQVYIYTDHGTLGLKKCGYDIDNAKERPRIWYSEDWDYYIGSCNKSIEYIKSSIGYDGKCLALGLARTDKLVNIDNSKVLSIKRKLGIENEKRKIVLYAPTFRDIELEKGVSSYDINFLSKVNSVCVVATIHPQAKPLISNYHFKDNIIDATAYPDVNELLLITDVLITDYSSVMFDFLIMKKPIIYYAYDYDNYVKYRGDFYLDYKKDLPGPVCYTQKELINTLSNIDFIEKKYKNKIKKFNNIYNINHDGNVCKRIVGKLQNGDFK